MLTYKKTLLGIVLVLLAAAYGWHWYALRQFGKAYADYAKVAAAHDEAALIPMLPENPLRRDLNIALSDALTGDISPETRLARANEGLALLVLSEGNIDSVGELGKDVTATINAMEDRAVFSLLWARPAALSIIELAQRRTSAVEDIRGLSYRANHHTEGIFEQIIADGGEMTPEHARSLERLLPEVEEQFNRRSNLSNDLETLASGVRTAFATYDASW